MTCIVVDATTLIALGSVGKLELLTGLDGTPVVLPAVASEVTTQPAKANLERFLTSKEVRDTASVRDEAVDRARALLEEPAVTADVRVTASILADITDDRSVALISDDRRLRTLTRGLGVPVTGTLGVVIRAVEEGLDRDDAEALVRQLDDQGLHMTGKLRDKAFELIDDAAR